MNLHGLLIDYIARLARVVREVDDPEPKEHPHGGLVLYHIAKLSNVHKILKSGLKPLDELGLTETLYGGGIQPPSNPKMVYLTRDKWFHLQFGEGSKEGLVVLEVHVKDTGKLYPDEDFIEQAIYSHTNKKNPYNVDEVWKDISKLRENEKRQLLYKLQEKYQHLWRDSLNGIPLRYKRYVSHGIKLPKREAGTVAHLGSIPPEQIDIEEYLSSRKVASLLRDAL